MRTSSEPLEGHKVKLTVEVDEEEIGKAEDDTLRRLTREARVPGFRPGKVPRRLLTARLGPKAIREEVIRDAVPRYYSDAVDSEELDVIAAPQIDVTSGEDSGPLVFDAVVEVRPVVSIAGYEGLVVTVPSPVPGDADIDAQVDRLRSQFATLSEVDRPARDGDLVTVDIHGTRAGAPVAELTADDLVYEVGTDGIVPGADEQLRGARVGDILEVEASEAPGGPAQLRMIVKLVRERVLPDADDSFADDASEFETIAELREDLRERLSRVRRLQANMALRERSIDALVALVDLEVPEALVAHQSEHLVSDLVESLNRERVPLADYLASTGQDEQGLLDEVRAQATRQAKADLALRALVVAESIEVDESDVDEEIVRLAGRSGQSPAEVREILERDGSLGGLRSDLRNAKALAWLVEHVEVVDDEGRPVDRSELLLEGATRSSTDAVGTGAELVGDAPGRQGGSQVASSEPRGGEASSPEHGGGTAGEAEPAGTVSGSAPDGAASEEP